MNGALSRSNDFNVRTGGRNEVKREGMEERSAFGERRGIDWENGLFGSELKRIGKKKRTKIGRRRIRRRSFGRRRKKSVDEVGSDDEHAVDEGLE